MPIEKTDRLGVAALEYIFSKHGWLFREQPTHDYGIDAHVEIVEGSKPTGKLIALQIKSGDSFFKEEIADAYIFRTDDKHVAYWLGHSMPVVLMLFEPNTKAAYWCHVNAESTESTGKGWKIAVSKCNVLEEATTDFSSLEELIQPEPYVRRLNRLRADRRWLDALANGDEVRIEFDDWVNKSLPRYQITIYSDSAQEEWPTLYAPGVSIENMLEHFFPWAEFATDPDAHYESSESVWMNECYSWRDPDDGEIYYSQSFDEWYQSPDGLMPVSENGETATYCLVLKLNDFGRAFLILDDYCGDPDAPENIGFTLE